MTHASLFSGIGGPEVAAAMLGWDNAFHCEINPFGRKVLEYWFPDSVSYEDITKTDFSPWRGRIDILTGGFPCQPFSYAGKRGGRADSRYLWPEMCRVVDQIRPTWVVGENVAGLATMVEGGILTELGSETDLFEETDGVHDYMLEESFTIEQICKDLESLEYSVQPVLIPAAAVGAPHRRDRIFILAHADDPHDRGEGGGSRVKMEKNTQARVRKPGEPADVRPAFHGAAQDTFGYGCGIGEDEEQGNRGKHGHAGPGDTERLCGEERAHAANAFRTRLAAALQPGGHDEKEWNDPRRPISMYTHYAWSKGTWWDNFPTVPPVHTADDGLSHLMDGAALSFHKWRNESIKAYGNAIVPQVMYRIFQAIEEVENGKI